MEPGNLFMFCARKPDILAFSWFHQSLLADAVLIPSNKPC